MDRDTEQLLDDVFDELQTAYNRLDMDLPAKTTLSKINLRTAMYMIDDFRLDKESLTARGVGWDQSKTKQ